MLGYRTLFQVQGNADGVLDSSIREFRHWLSTKVNLQYDGDSLEFGVPARFGDDAAALLLREDQPDGSHSVRATLTEVNQAGRWTTRLTASAPRDRSAWVWVDVDGPAERSDGSGKRQWTSTPRLAKALLDMFDAYDGLGPLRVSPAGAHIDDLDAIVDLICDPDRRGLLFLAGSPMPQEGAAWPSKVARVLKETAGLASAFVLDAETTQALEEAIGVDHRAPAGAIRTYRPGADPASLLDARRHRILGGDRLVNDDERYLSRLLGWSAREAAIEEPLPKSVRRLDARFEEMTNAILVDRVYRQPVELPVAEPAPEPRLVEAADPVVDGTEAAASATVAEGEVAAAAEFLTRLAAVLADVLGRDQSAIEPMAELTRLASFATSSDGLLSAQTDLTTRLDELSAGVQHLEEELAEARKRIEDEQLDHAETAQELVRAQAGRDRLRTELSVLGRADIAWSVEATDAVEELPDSFSTLLRRLPELTLVRFTGDGDCARDLEAHDALGTWAAKAWQALRAANGYAQAKADRAFEGSLDMYLQDTPAGLPGYSKQRHARDESEVVKRNEKHHQVRVFPVPTTVDASGHSFMGAHFKIAQFGMISPRIHYLDATAADGLIYVGYIGAHLPTSRTN